jgi:hypothetical protein
VDEVIAKGERFTDKDFPPEFNSLAAKDDCPELSKKFKKLTW